MSIGTKVIRAALQKIQAHSTVKNANPESIDNGRLKLNSFIAQLEDDGIEFGAKPLEAPGEELGEPLGVTNIIEDNLAILLQPDHPGTQVSPELRRNAKRGMNYLRRKYKVTEIPKRVVSNTMPTGSGNIRSKVFFDTDDTIG